MIATMGKEITKELIRLLKEKDRAFIATLIYIVCAVLSLLSFVAIILPFSVNISFMDNVTWKNSLEAGRLLLHITFAVCLINTVVCIVRWAIIKNLYNSSNQSFRRICGALYTIEDIVELISSLFALMFVLSVFVQIHKTLPPFLSAESVVIYLFVGWKFLSYLWNVFKSRNLKIIDEVLQRYKDLD